MPFLAIPFKFLYMKRTLRSPNVMIMAVNFNQDMKSTIINETHLLEVVTAIIYPRHDICSEGTVAEKVISHTFHSNSKLLTYMWSRNMQLVQQMDFHGLH
jgi:hypothetical protein